MGFNNVEKVRQGKFFEIELIETDKKKAKDKAEEICKKLLANLVIEDYKIIDFNKFKSENDAKEKNIAATLLKIQERKTLKGNSYAILKLTDLTSVFELFIFL